MLEACRGADEPSDRVVLTTAGDPRYDEAKALAASGGSILVTLSPSPLRLAILDRGGRPLGYRVSGLTPPRFAVDDDATRRAVATLVADAGPGELIAEHDFDPGDPELVWLDPYTRGRITLERALDIAGDVLRHRSRVSRRSVAVGVTRWKRPAARAFLTGPNGEPEFARSPADAVAAAKACSGRIVAWASRKSADDAERAAEAAGVAFGRIEDGFLRSVGLGSAFTTPLSLVLDEGGIYYDPSRPSDLETLLAGADIPDALITRAAALRARLVAESVTKYNVGDADRLVVPNGAFVTLVPGQVEDDASILKGAGAVRTNLELLAAARARRPDAYIIYKPHPDVVAGYRAGAMSDAQALAHANAVASNGSIASLYPICHAVETITSLSGFEALMRGLQVTTHGQPFYAGWGLTEDLAPQPRRGRARSLDELVAAALILYPLYVDPVSGLPCGPETALDRLVEARARAMTPRGRLLASLRHAYALARHRVLGPIGRRLG